MSRIAKAPVVLPKGVEVSISDGSIVVKGPKGVLTQRVHQYVKINIEEGEQKQLTFQPHQLVYGAWMQAGTTRALVNNMVKGVVEGFKVALELVGIGYRVQASKHQVTLSLGFSHPIVYTLPEGIHAEVQGNNVMVLHGMDKQRVGQIAAEIRALRPPEPYKGKGVRRVGEKIIQKEAKKKK